jgi:glyoxylase-like metal-dependent hydrolase (beta-lactamase superfamily II)/8-oxo-dGTP pyrophosphatase MutT (NUDIX family)
LRAISIASAIAEAAGILLARGPGSHEVFIVRRNERLRAFGGFHAFPGGKVSPQDAALLPGVERGARLVAAIRELFEEIGILHARRGDGTFPSTDAELDAWRRKLSAGEATFAEVLSHFGASIDPTEFEPVADFVTPAFAPLRFDTTFYFARLPPSQEPAVWPGELEAGRWAMAGALLDEWTRGECHIAPPALTILEAIRGRPVEEIASRLASVLAARPYDAIPPIYYAPHVLLIPLHTIALPPSTHTNAFLVGNDPAYLIDPGSTDAAEQKRLFDLIDEQRALGVRLAAVVLSHHHPDHIGAATQSANRYRVPIWASAQTAELLAGQIGVDRIVQDGDWLELGTAPDGSAWHLDAIYTPGHASGHLAFFEPHYRLLFAGDMVSMLSSVVIAPPDGDLAVYLQSLERLQGIDARLLLPSHGSPTVRAAAVLEEAIAHRRQREEQLLAALSTGPRQIPDLAIELYKGLPAPLMRFAHMQIAAGLEKLQREGLARSSSEGWTILLAEPNA